MTKRAITYARCSGNDKLKTGGENLTDQTHLCREYAIKQGYHIVADLAEDDRGASGATFDLPQLSEALRLAHAGGYEVLVVRELDRLSRDLAKQLIVEQELKQAGVTIEYVLYDFPDTPEGRLNKNLRAMLAEYEREKITQRLVRGRKRRAKMGNVILHGHAPYGYKGVEREDRNFLEIEESQAEIVRLIFQWYTVGDGNSKPMSIEQIKDTLTAMKVPTGADLKMTAAPKRVRGYGEWNRTALARMLSSETYIGQWYYGEENIPVKVPAIIDKQVWEAAQTRKLQNRRDSKRNTKYKYLLQSRLRCAECHYLLRTVTRKSRSGHSYRQYYHCQAADRDLPCTNKYHYRADRVDKATWEWIKELLSEPQKLEDGLDKYRQKQEEATKPLRNRLQIIETMLQSEQSKYDKVLDVYLEGHIEKDEFLERKQRYMITLDSLRAQRDEVKANLHEQAVDSDWVLTIMGFAEAMHDELIEAEEDFQARRRLVELLNVTGEIAFEDGERVLYLHCVVGEKRVSIASQSTSSRAMDYTAHTGTITSARQ
ncbi:MAG TPA: recombinase family protein [Anaerolineae bacterium]|nr:recombinase family protein [Anaerolineae bacterium]